MAAIHVPRTVGELRADPREPYADGQVPAWDAALGRFAPRALTALGGDLTYVHHQLAPAAVWTYAHNLGKYPSVTIVDSGGNEVRGIVSYLDINTVSIAFFVGGQPVAFGGSAFNN
jgi:hypothetical protein